MNSNIISFIFGVLVKIVDDINDYNIYKEFQTSFESILLLLTMYILFLDKQLHAVASSIFFLGGIIGLVFAPHIVDAQIWRWIILLSILPFFHTLWKIYKERKNINIKDWKNAVFLILPLVIFAIIFSLIEDKLVPEEISKIKLVERIFQSTMVTIFIYILPQLQMHYKLSATQYQGLSAAAWGWLGYVIASILGIVIFFQYPLLEKFYLLN